MKHNEEVKAFLDSMTTEPVEHQRSNSSKVKTRRQRKGKESRESQLQPGDQPKLRAEWRIKQGKDKRQNQIE